MKARKTSLLLALILGVSLLTAGCGGGESPALTVYESASGITIQMKDGMKEDEYEGFAAYFEGKDCMMSAIKETYVEYQSIGYDAADMSIEEYAALIKEVNGLTEDFEVNQKGNLYVTYTNTVDENEFFYYTTLRKSSDSFWVISFACFVDKQDDFLEQFDCWADTIEFK